MTKHQNELKDKAYIAVDPGAKGSVCILIPGRKKAFFYDTVTKPSELVYVLNQAQKELDVQIAMIEDVHAIFGTSAKSNFNFGFNTGLITGIIQSSGIGLDKVTPKKWQKYIGVKTKGKLIKKEVAGICDRIYPHISIRGPQGGLLDGKSDSLMIAHYTSLIYGK